MGEKSRPDAYEEYRVARDREQTLQNPIREWFSHLQEIPEEFEDVKPDLLPVIRSRAHFELSTLRRELEQGDQYSWPYQVLGEHFGVALVYDLSGAMRPVPQANLDAWGVTFYEALDIAKENLREIPATFIGPTVGDGVYLSETEDSYDASRLLFPEVLQEFHIIGDPIALVLTRAQMVVLGSEDVERLCGIAEVALGAVESPLYVSGIAMHYDGDEWVPWLPPPDHPAYYAFRHLRIQTMMQEYAEQRELLEKLQARNKEEGFVVTYDARQNPQGEPFSYSIWAGNVLPALLPKTDLIAFTEGGDDALPRLVPWERVVKEAGDLMEPVDIYPSRYRVRRYPSAKRLKAMGNLFV